MGSSKTERKPVVNIGMIGHVDHGKTTLVNALSGEWTDRHSEEIKRGISIRLGYADATFRKCPVCSEPDCYTVEEVCKICGTKTNEMRTVSFVDSPGHEALMATMLSGAAIMDGAVLLIAASESCPQPQTEEHLMALNIVGIEKIVIAQNKIDLVSREEAIEHYKQIKEFVKGTIAENSPIVPISAQQAANIDVLIKCIEEVIPTPERPEEEIARMYIARSFDINRPGTPIRDLKGGVVGGSLLRGQLRIGDRLEIRPGRVVTGGGKSTWEPLETEITSIVVGGTQVKEVAPGGLLGIGTMLDPSMTKEDALVGQCAGKPGTLPPTWEKLSVDFQLFKRAVGVKKEEEKVPAIKVGENIMLSAGTSITIGEVKKVTKKTLELILSRPVCAETGSRVAIGRKIRGRWHLIGAGTIK